MIQVPCPWCGKRDVTEFRYGGEAHIARPLNPGTTSEKEWGDYLFFRKNTKGVMRERWYHALGCHRWFNAERDTVSDKFIKSYQMGEKP